MARIVRERRSVATPARAIRTLREVADSAIGGASEVLGRAWSDITSVQVAPSDVAIWLTAAAVLAVVVLPQTWPLARHAVTAAHEGAHGVAALLTGRRQRGITLHRDTSGRARSHGPTRGAGLAFTTAAGCPGPALLGLGAALLLAGGHALAVLWVAIGLLALLLLQIRNVWGVVVVLGLGAALFAVTWWAAPETQSLAAYALAWFLLLAAPRPVWELVRRRRRGARDSDADVLGRLTPIPAAGWVMLFAAVTLGSLVLGGRALVA